MVLEVNTYPGNKSYARIHQSKRKGMSSTIPVWLPRWYQVTSMLSEDFIYARISHLSKNKVTVFNRTNMTKHDLDKSSVGLIYNIKEKLNDADNHRVEDLFECLYLSAGKKYS
jgi:hypothetical protein